MQELPHRYSVEFAGGTERDLELSTNGLPTLRSASPASIRCAVTGTLDRIDRATQFTDVNIDVRLAVPAGTSPDQARRALEKAERGCLVSNSLKATIHLTTTVDAAAETSGALVSA